MLQLDVEEYMELVAAKRVVVKREVAASLRSYRATAAVDSGCSASVGELGYFRFLPDPDPAVLYMPFHSTSPHGGNEDDRYSTEKRIGILNEFFQEHVVGGVHTLPRALLKRLKRANLGVKMKGDLVPFCCSDPTCTRGMLVASAS